MACMIDFRRLDEGFGGKTYKRKRQAQADGEQDAMDLDETVAPTAKRSAVASSENPDKPIFGRPTYDGVIAGKVSGRKWKQVRTRRTSATQVRMGKSVEERNKEKELKKAFRERKEELKEVIRKNKTEKRLLREAREKKKKENIMKSGTKLQKVTNPKTLEKIRKSKKRTRLISVPSDKKPKDAGTVAT